MKMDNLIERKIERWAKTYALPVNIVKSQVMVESGGDQWACRFEKRWRWFLNPMIWAKLVNISKATEVVCQQMSWGLLQVMGTVARELGHKEDITRLCDVDIGLKYGCMKLRKEVDRWGSMERGLAAYNAGHPKRKAGQIYSIKVRTGAAAFKN